MSLKGILWVQVKSKNYDFPFTSNFWLKRTKYHWSNIRHSLKKLFGIIKRRDSLKYCNFVKDIDFPFGNERQYI